MYFMALIYYTCIIFRCDSHNNRQMRNAQGCAPRLWEAQPKQAICRKRKLSINCLVSFREAGSEH